MVVVEEIPPFYVKRFEYPEKSNINVTNYYKIVSKQFYRRYIFHWYRVIWSYSEQEIYH